MKYFVIRTSEDDKDWIYSEILKGILRQGWGIPGSNLKDQNTTITETDWISNYQKAALTVWKETVPNDAAIKRYKILSIMLDIGKNDLIVVPRIPQYNNFLVCKSIGNYTFDNEKIENRNGYDDFRHSIPIDKDNIKIFSYSSSPESKLIKGKFRAYQSAVNNVWNQSFISAADKLYKQKSDFAVKDVNELINSIKPEIFNSYLPKIINLGHKEVEEVVKNIFINAGYEILHTNYYDGKGGDADLVLHHKMPIFSESIEDYGQKIYVQIKTKKGEDSDDEKGVDQLIKIASSDPDALKVLISTSPNFSEKCKIKAKANDVLLISGQQLMPLVIKYS